ncbi:hypothetical protein JTE90_026396 [Oedothorax gibbosus]|uniref:acid phosphatase n=1 Tax=Oedothorax gibbosus TaxID=931172 RepID=A0AAV6VDY9_9ARAC|nr:hypothetical protein JTE90_026396 [Oedothorax gibbosus]
MKLLLFSLTCVLCQVQPIFSAQNSKLLFVQFLYRHGDRNPINLYPNDPNPESAFKGGLHQLTLLGRKQHYALGKHFRSMYRNFTTFSPYEIAVVSSYADRCVMSAETNLASFFPPNSEWSFENNVNWQPIPIRYLPKAEDKYLEDDSYCPRADEEEKRILYSPEGQQFMAEHKEMYENLTLMSGKDLANWTQASYFHDTIFIEKKYNLSVPSWVEPYYEELTNVSNLAFFWTFNSPLMHRLRAGPLIQRLINNMNDKIAGTLKDLKFQVFSAHDTTIAVVLDALNLFNMIQPPYASTLLFELHEMPNGANALRMLYMNSSRPEERIEEPHVLILEGCSEFCPLSYFINYTKDLMPEDWEQECKLDKTLAEKIKDQKFSIYWLFLFVGVVIASIGVYAVWRIYSRKQDKKHVFVPNYNTIE